MEALDEDPSLHFPDVGPVQRHDIRAGFRKTDRDALAYAVVGSRHDGCFSAQIEHITHWTNPPGC